jgi:hypothetical protein
MDTECLREIKTATEGGEGEHFAHRRLRTRPQRREPDPERLPHHGRPLQRCPGEGARRLENVTVVM